MSWMKYEEVSTINWKIVKKMIDSFVRIKSIAN